MLARRLRPERIRVSVHHGLIPGERDFKLIEPQVLEDSIVAFGGQTPQGACSEGCHATV